MTNPADAYSVSSDELRQFIECIEHLNDKKADIAVQTKEVFEEAVGRGYDAKVLRRVIAIRKLKPDDLAEFEAVLEVYRAAVGM